MRRFLRRTRPRLLWRAFLVVAVLVASAATAALWGLARDLPSPRAVLADGAVTGLAARIYDRNGNLLYEVLPPGDEAGKRAPVTLAQFPESLIEATLATEDAAFYEHPGIDWQGIARALRRNWREGQVAAGGSTITQQVARMTLLPAEERHERSLRRKAREAILALRLEHQFTKDEILELYLNNVYYGNLAYGAEAAAQSYFGKHVWELSAAESAMLAGLPQAPALYSPLDDLEAAKARQADVLRLMAQNGYLSSQEAELAGQEALRFAATPFPIEAPHFVMWVLRQLEQRFGEELADGTGLRVTTTLDLGLQDLAQATVVRRLEELQGRRGMDPDRNVHNAALVAMDPRTGDVLAMVGSPDYFDASIDGAVNVALMPRQPGSALKPMTYATAFDPTRSRGTPWSPATVASDVPTTFLTGDDKLYAPQNYDLRFQGPMALREALATSNNVIAVKVLEHVGVEAMIQTARDLGIRSLDDPARYDLTVTLGGGEVTLLELTNAYATLAAQGTRRPARGILRVETADGATLWEAREPVGTPALDPRVAALVTDILADPLARAPVFGEWNALRLPFPAAAKTGTTTDWRDNWTLGYTPSLVAGVWVGNADNSPMRDVSGIDGAGPIWHDFMKQALRHERHEAFAMPQGIEAVEVCKASGLLPDALCPERRVEYFLEGAAPTAQDHSYQLVRVNEATGLLAGPGCEGGATERLFRAPPPEAMEWARQNGWPFPPTRQCSGALAAATNEASTLHLLSPANGSEYRVDPSLPIESQRLPLAIGATDALVLEEGTLLLDGVPVGTFTELPYQYLWPLAPGTHTVQAVGTSGDGRSVESNVVEFVVR